MGGIGKRRGRLESALGATCDHVLKLNYQSIVERPISGEAEQKVVERPARVDGNGKEICSNLGNEGKTVIVLR